MNGVTRHFTESNHSNKDFMSLSVSYSAYSLVFGRAQQRPVLALMEFTVGRRWDAGPSYEKRNVR
jgi:hypothetical protein